MSNPTLTDRHRECANEIMTRAYEGTYSGGIQFNLIDVAKLLAEKFPAPSPTTEPLYRIKPLVFEHRRFHGLEIYEADSLQKNSSYYVRENAGKWDFYLPGDYYRKCDSLEDGKAKCEAHYKAFLAQALEVVEP